MAGKRVLLCLCLAILSGCGSSGDTTLERDIQRGIAQIQSVHDRKALQEKLTALVAKLRHDAAGSQSARRARALAVRGFEAKLTSVKAEREFYENDSGQVAEATVDAARADKYQQRADELLRAAQQAIGGD
jgi:polyisoprenoid-binding protein YceI